MWEKSVAQSETGPVTISLWMPTSSPSRCSPGSRANRLSTAMLRPRGHPDRVLWAVEHRAAGVVLLAGRHDAVGKHLSVTLLVVAEHAGGEVVAASVTLTETGVDPHFHQNLPLR
jgi:hypothetical protein